MTKLKSVIEQAKKENFNTKTDEFDVTVKKVRDRYEVSATVSYSIPGSVAEVEIKKAIAKSQKVLDRAAEFLNKNLLAL